MTNSQPKPSRLQLVKADYARGKTAKGPSASSEQKMISLGNLVSDPNNERKTFRGIDELAASLKAATQLEPIIVTPYLNGKYLIIAGERRYRAAPLAGLDELEAIVRSEVDDEQRAIRGITSNLQREDTPPIERAQALKAMIERFKYSQEQLAKKLGKSKGWVSEMLRILDLPKALLEKFGAPNFSPSSDTVVRIARIQDPEFQAQLVDALLQGAPQKEIRALIQAHKEVKTGKRPAASLPKPKWVFHTEHGADIIVQSKKARLSLEERILALQEALKQARAERA